VQGFLNLVRTAQLAGQHLGVAFFGFGASTSGRPSKSHRETVKKASAVSMLQIKELMTV
jgi:hypothetical protein